jgi:hypothetical protein
VAFNRDAAIRHFAPNDTGDLIDAVLAIRCELGAVKLKIDTRKIDRDAAAGFTGFNVAFLEFLNQRLILGDFGTLLIDSFLLLGLLYFLALELIADKCAGTQSQRAPDRRANPGATHCGPDGPAGSGTSQSTDAGAFFTGSERSAGTPRSQDK